MTFYSVIARSLQTHCMIVFCFISQEEMKMCTYGNVLLIKIMFSEGIIKFSYKNGLLCLTPD